LLAYMLELSPEVARIRNLIRKRLMDEPRIRASEKILDQMLLILARAGFVTLEPEPPAAVEGVEDQGSKANSADSPLNPGVPAPIVPPYSPVLANPMAKLEQLLVFRSVHPLYAAFLLEQLGIADRDERLQALESVLEMPRPLLRYVRVPGDLPPGPLAMTRLDADLVSRGLIAAPVPDREEEDDEDDRFEERPPALADKLRLLFDARYAEIEDVSTQAVWCAAELLRFNGNFNLYVKARDLVKQEGIIFRHLLRLILLCGEFAQVAPTEGSADDWRAELRDVSERLTASCREIDPTSTDEAIERAHAADVVEGESQKKVLNAELKGNDVCGQMISGTP
jgi:hypothetical protein